MIKRGDACEASSTTPPPTWNLRVSSWNLILQGWQNWAVAAGVALAQTFDASETKGNFSRITSISSHPPTSRRPRLCLPLQLVPTPPPSAATRHFCPGVWKEDSNEKWPPTQRISSWAVTSFRLPFLLL